MLLPVAVLCALTLTEVGLLARPMWSLLGVLAGLDAAWVLTNGPIEGPTLLTLTTYHGVTLADLVVVASVPVLVYAVTELVRRRRDVTQGSPSASLERR